MGKNAKPGEKARILGKQMNKKSNAPHPVQVPRVMDHAFLASARAASEKAQLHYEKSLPEDSCNLELRITT